MKENNVIEQFKRMIQIVKRIALERHDDKMLVVSTAYTGIYYTVTLCKSGPEGRPITEIVRTSELEERIKQSESKS